MTRRHFHLEERQLAQLRVVYMRFRNDYDGVYYDYVLAHAAFDPPQLTQPGPRWRTVIRRGSWALYEKY